MQDSINLITTAFIKLCERTRTALRRSLWKRFLPRAATIMVVVTLAGWGGYTIQQKNVINRQQEQIQTLQLDFNELNTQYDETVVQLDSLQHEHKTLESKAKLLQDQKEELEQSKGELEERNAELERRLQAKREAQQNQPTVVAFAAPSGDCTDWIRQAGVSDVSSAYWLIMKESGCNVYATNASSGAYGIPQALPGSKMASAGADWQTNPVTQIRWMDSYVNGRYGGWSQAVAFWQANHWY